MQIIRTLAPTIVDAVKAVEQGCLKIQNDPQFQPHMWSWLSIDGQLCFGCLATTTIMHLTNKTGKDIIQTLTKDSPVTELTFYQLRSTVFDIAPQSECGSTDFSLFETAIDNLRYADLWPLLTFYKLQDHTNAREAAKWLSSSQPNDIHYETTKADLVYYGNFLRELLIPLLEKWFS